MLKLFQEFDIRYVRGSINQSYVISIVERFGKDEAEKKKYEELKKKFRIRITQQTRLPLKQEYLMKGLTEAYPQYLEMLKTIDEDNAKMDCAGTGHEMIVPAARLFG